LNHGAISRGKVRLHFEAKTTKFSDLADDSQAFEDYE
jgi:replicative DNA helicase